MSTPEASYEPLLAATAESARQALYERCDDGVVLAEQSRLAADASPLRGLAYPAVCVTADRADGVPGGAYLCTSAAGTRALSIRSLDPLPPEASDEPLGDGDLQAASEWAVEVLAGIGAGVAEVLGGPLAFSQPSARVLSAADGAPAREGDAPVALCVSLRVHGELCVLVLALPDGDGAQPASPAPAAPTATPPPQAAAAEPATAAEPEGLPPESEPAGPPVAAAFAQAGPGEDLEVDLSGTRVRVWAELGQARLPLRRAINLPIGGVVELDCEADAPVDLYVNGLRFARGQLVITGDGEWALRVDEIDSSIPPAA